MADENKPDVAPVETVAEEPKDNPQARINAFTKEYGELVAKYHVDFIQYPLWQPDGTPRGWKMTLELKALDTKTLPQKSPFVAQPS
jgi:hypothetical protein